MSGTLDGIAQFLADVEAAVGSAWEAMKREGVVPEPANPRELWLPRVSPALPAAWPPDGSQQLVSYALATSIGHVADGEYVSRPWARVTGNLVTRSIELEVLTRRLVVAGVHGVGPATDEQIETMQLRDEATRQLCDLAAEVRSLPISAPVVTRYYALVLVRSGILDDLRDRHTGFVDWVLSAAPDHGR